MFVLHVLIFIGSFSVPDMSGEETNRHRIFLKTNITMNVQNVPGSLDFLSIKDTPEKARNLDLELYVKFIYLCYSSRSSESAVDFFPP